MKKLFVMSLSVFFAHVLCGSTLTWSGGSSGVLSAASNWGGATPQSGDVLTFSKAVTVTGSFDLGAMGVTFDCSGGDVTSEVTFTGAGTLTKKGTSGLVLSVAPEHQGGILVANGQLTVLASAKAYAGVVTIDRTTAASTAQIYFKGDATAVTFANPLAVTGTYGGKTASVLSGGSHTLSGAITSEGDLRIENSQNTLTLGGTVTVPVGNTVTLYGNGGNKHIVCNAPILGNVAKRAGGWNVVTLNAACGRIDDTLDVGDGKVEISKTGSWGGTNVVVSWATPGKGFRPEFTLNDSNNLRRDATLSLTDQYQLTVYADVTVKELFRNGVRLPDKSYARGELGAYPAEDGMSYHGGAGVIVVDSSTAVGYQWIGGGSGSLTDPENWACKQAPVPGETLVFKDPVTVTGAFDFGEAGLTLACEREVRSEVAFSGSGTLTKTGNKTLTLAVASSHTGGVAVNGGGVSVADASGAGSGCVTVDRTQAGAGTFVQFSGGKAFANAIDVKGSFGGETVPAVQSTDANTLSGAITSAGDLWLQNQNTTTMKLTGSITVPEGKTVVFDGRTGSSSFIVSGTVMGSIKKVSANNAWNSLVLQSVSGRPGDVLTIASGTLTIASSGGWNGLSLVIDKQYAFKPEFTLNNGAKLNADATIDASGDFALTLEGNVVVKALVYEHQEMPAGFYRKGDLDGKFLGAGVLKVGVPEYVWNGGSYGLWTDSANWTPQGVPGVNATVVFPKSVTVGAGEASSIGNADFYLQCDTGVEVVLSNVLSGVGRLYKTGAGKVTVCTANEYSGGTVVVDGTFEIWNKDGAGSGDVEVRCASGKNPVFAAMRSGVVPNNIFITGPTRKDPAPLLTANAAKFGGLIMAENSFYTGNSYSGRNYPVVYQGGIEAPAATMYVGPIGWSNIDTASAFACDVNASIYKDISACPLYFQSGTIGMRSGKLTIIGGTNVVQSAAHVAYTNIVVSKAEKAKCCAMRVENGACLEPDAEIRLENGGMLVLPSGVKLCIGKLYVDGILMDEGTYSARNLPNAIGGAGRVRLGPPRGSLLIVR